MNTNKANLTMRALVMALQSALFALGAVATARAADEDDAVRQLTQPTNFVEFGAGYVSQDSYKFGEYNGLQDQGLFGILNFLFSGGAPYDSDSAVRWHVVGANLGLDSREVKADYGEQGIFQLNFDYDELRRNRSDSYQTPYLGAGGSGLTLPSDWLAPRVPQVNANNINFRSLLPSASQTPALVGGVLVQPTAAQLTQLNNIAATDAAAFHNVDLYTKRERTQAGFSYQISPHWDVKASAQNENKDGLKPMSTVSSQVSEFAAVIPDRIDQTTQQYNASLNYTADKSFMQMGYYGSIYNNHVDSMTWQDVNDPTKSATMSSAPSNEFHQFNLTGGYHFSPLTKLVVNGSYARNTQNDTFLVSPQLPLGTPVNSLNGLVVTEAFNAKLTSQPMKGLNVNVGYKFDDHDNRTPVNTYIFQDANEAPSSTASPFNSVLGLPANTLANNINIYANRPYSKRLNQFDANADYAIAPGQTLKAGYQYQQIDRKCNGDWINCADAPRTKENTGQLEWRMNVIENLTTSLSYAYSHRTVNYDENAFLALVPMANFIPAGGATVSVYDYLVANGLTGFGPYAPFPATPLTGDTAIFSPNNNIVPQGLYGSRNNINELLGLRRYNMADRNRDKVRAKLDWQASDKVSFDGSIDYYNDDYSHSLYGLTGAKNWTLNLEGDYSISENVSSDLFYTYEDRDTQSAGRAYGSNSNTAFVGIADNTVVSGGCFTTVRARNNNTKIDPCLDWSTDSKDKVHTFGVGLNYKGLMGGKLAVSGDLVGTRARTNIGVTGGSYVNNPLAAAGQPAVTPATYFIPATAFPTITTNTVEFRLNTQWTLNKSSVLRMFYWFAHLKASDYAYDGMQFGTLTSVMPTNEQPQSYNVSVVGLTYAYHWQ
jgi:MtrB/PioB family decaheme-associated outer membrane protein